VSIDRVFPVSRSRFFQVIVELQGGFSPYFFCHSRPHVSLDTIGPSFRCPPIRSQYLRFRFRGTCRPGPRGIPLPSRHVFALRCSYVDSRKPQLPRRNRKAVFRRPLARAPPAFS